MDTNQIPINFLRRFKVLTSSPTVRQSAITAFSTFSAAGLGAVYYLLLARLLGPEKYGLFSLTLQIMLSITPIADLGTGTAMVRFIGERPNNYKSFTSSAFRIKIITGLISFFILFFGANIIANFGFHEPKLAGLLPIAAIGVIVFLMFNFSIAILQGLQKFSAWGGIQVGSNLFRLVLLGVIFIIGQVNSEAAIAIFILSFVFGFVLSWKFITKDVATSPVNSGVLKDLWNFNKWTALFTITASITSRMDSFFTARYLDLAQTGIYSLAVVMSSLLPQVAAALGAVTAPKFSAFNSRSQTHTYLKKSLPFALVVSLGVGILMVPAAIFVVWFTGRDFSPAFAPFIILLISMMIFAGTGPIRDSLLFAYKKPQIFFYAALIQGLIITICGYFLIPSLGITGAAISSLMSQVSILVICIFYYFKLSKNR